MNFHQKKDSNPTLPKKKKKKSKQKGKKKKADLQIQMGRGGGVVGGDELFFASISVCRVPKRELAKGCGWLIVTCIIP